MTMQKKALITGITGQIGSYLAELLLEKGYSISGISRGKLDSRLPPALLTKITFSSLDIADTKAFAAHVKKIQPDEIYNLAAQSNSQISFGIAGQTLQTNAMAVIALCDVALSLKKPVRIVQAASAELFGGVYNAPVNEETPFVPKNPYGVAKLAAYWTVRNYRETKGLCSSNALIFNSESPRRGEAFVTKKIAATIAAIMKGTVDVLMLGNVNTTRDWSHAADTAQALYLMAQAEKGADYIVSSGIAHTVREFVEIAFKHMGIEIAWRGEGLGEEGFDRKSGRVYVKIDPQFFRPAELKSLIGDSSKIRKELDWKPTYTLTTLVGEMVDAELKKK